jgi:hypothetical protein
MRSAPMKKWTFFALLSIFILAAMLRLLQLLNFSVWGSDTGEYYYITEQLSNSGKINFEYDGWGFGYPYFPSMFILLSGFANLSGLSVFTVILFVIPIISAFSVYLMFILVKRLLKNSKTINTSTTDRIALVGAAFYAVAMPHIFTTSHPMPGTLGDFLLLFCLILLLKTYENNKFIIPLALCSTVLIFTHHLSSFLLVTIVILIMLYREFTHVPDDIKRTKIDFGYVCFLLTGIFVYWIFIAVPFKKRVLENATGFSAEITVVLAYIGLAVLAIIIFKILPKFFKWKYVKHTRPLKVLSLRFSLFLFFSSLFMIIVAIIGVPGTNLTIELLAILTLSPLLIFIAFATFGNTFARNAEDGMFVYGWLTALALVMCFSMAISSREILVYRIFQYLIPPLSVWIGVGFVYFFICIDRNEGSGVFSEIKSHTVNAVIIRSPHIRVAAVSSILILILTSCIFSYPPGGLLSGFEEGTTDRELESCTWIRESIEVDGIVASDHRMSSMVFGFGYTNATWETAPDTIRKETLEDHADELNSTKTPSGEKRIDYVLISSEIKNNVALTQWEPAEPMTKNAIEKFEKYPYYKIYDNGEVEIFMVSW